MKNTKGFTIIELMVVIAILGLLSFIAVSSYSHVNASTSKTVCFSNIQSIVKAIVVNNFDEELNIIDLEINDYFTKEVTCPEGGDYSVTYDSEHNIFSVECSVHGKVNSSVGESDFEGLYIDFSSENFDLTQYVHDSNYKIKKIGDKFYLRSRRGIFLAGVDITDNYKISTKAILAESNKGAYAILFEAENDGDTLVNGYSAILNFGKDTNANHKSLLLQTTTDGKNKTKTSDRIDLTEYIPEAENDEWWFEEHEISVEAKYISSESKLVTVIIDGVTIEKEEGYTYDVEPFENATDAGLRSFGSKTYYSDFEYEDIP